MAKLSEQSNQLLYFLSMMTAVLLPMTIISGLFGMNVGGIPLAESPNGFWMVSIFATAVAAAVLYVLRRIGGAAGCDQAGLAGACEHRPGIDRQRRPDQPEGHRVVTRERLAEDEDRHEEDHGRRDVLHDADGREPQQLGAEANSISGTAVTMPQPSSSHTSAAPVVPKWPTPRACSQTM